MLIGRMNNDLLLFTMQEFQFVSLPDSMTTGSSIMPQKRNYDLCELVRGNVPVYLGQSDQLRNIYTHLMSGYQRDLQLTKKIFIEATDLAENIIEIFGEIIDNLQIQTETLNAAMTDELYATERVYELVRLGMSFRDAYMEVKQTLFH
jgi:argininosuccinate lyase